jgi:hypothetical protein
MVMGPKPPGTGDSADATWNVYRREIGICDLPSIEIRLNTLYNMCVQFGCDEWCVSTVLTHN